MEQIILSLGFSLALVGAVFLASSVGVIRDWHICDVKSDKGCVVVIEVREVKR